MSTHPSVHELLLAELNYSRAAILDGPVLARRALLELALAIEAASGEAAAYGRAAEIVRVLFMSPVPTPIEKAAGDVITALGVFQTLRITPITLGASANWVTLLPGGAVIAGCGHVQFVPAAGVTGYYNVGAAASASTLLIPPGGIAEPYDSEDVVDGRLYGTGGTLFIVEEK